LAWLRGVLTALFPSFEPAGLWPADSPSSQGETPRRPATTAIVNTFAQTMFCGNFLGGYSGARRRSISSIGADKSGLMVDLLG
jgi:hypothetical protein